MRGKLQPHRQAQPQTRITPADAGKTRACCRYRTAKQDHPRGCGENCPYFEPVWGDKGSPPRMRGKPARMLLRLLMEGITPADAGKTNIVRYSVHGHEDHPRGCGENSQFPAQISRASGSPPRMRGKHGTYGRKRQQRRITPADAGKTVCSRSAALKAEDHPRGCGENCQLRAPVQRFSGSPPRMRGKLGALPEIITAIGITPADAGKTAPTDGIAGSTVDHPRGCGENAMNKSI